MNSMLFSKLSIDLNCCSTEDELISMMAQIHSSSLQYSKSDSKSVVILLDHVLDCTQGISVLLNLRDFANKFDIEMIWVLVSSTEDRDTVNSYTELGVEKIITKPLSINKIKGLMEYLEKRSKYEGNLLE